jgi:hypothetical protein
MAEQLNYNINISGNANESVGSIKKQLKEANAELIQAQKNFGEYSNEAINAAKKVAALRDSVQEARETADLFDPGKKFQALSGTLSAVAGGFAAVQGAVGLLGGESKELEKQLLRVQSALALSQGLSTITDSVKDFQRLGAVIQSTTIFQKANAAANALTATTLRAVGVAAETSAIGFKVLKTAIVSTGIGILVIALGELVSALMNYTSAADKAKKKQEELNEVLANSTKEGLKAAKGFVKSQAELNALRAKSEGATEEEITKIRIKAIKDQIFLNAGKYETLLRLDKKAATEIKEENATLQDELTKIELEGQIKRNEQKKQQAEKTKAQAEKDKAQLEKDAAEEIARQKARDERESAAQQIQIDAFRSTLEKRQQDILAAEDDFEKKKGELIKAGVTDFTLVQEQYRIKLLEINKNYDKQDEDEANKVKEQKLAALETDRQRELETRQLEAETLQQRKDAELFSLSSEYQIKYDLAVKNGEDLLLLREFYAAKEAAIVKKYNEDEQKQDQAKLQAKINTLNEVALVLGAFSTLAGEQTRISKGLTLAQIGVDTASAISSLTKNSEANPANSVTFGAAGTIQFATGLIRILANIKKAKDILVSPKTNTPTFSSPTTTAAPVSPRQPQAQLTQLNQDSINAIGNSAIRAYVVETDITSNQKRVQAIKQRARFS